MATQKAITANPVRNRGGTIIWGIASSSNAITASFGVTKVASNGLRGNRMTDGAYSRASNAALGPYNTLHPYPMLIGYQLKLAGYTVPFPRVASVLNPFCGMNRIESFRTIRRVTAGWNYTTGRFLTTPTSAYDAMESIDNSSNVDTASRPSRAVPGEFAYLTGKPTATRTTYRAKTG